MFAVIPGFSDAMMLGRVHVNSATLEANSAVPRAREVNLTILRRSEPMGSLLEFVSGSALRSSH